MAALTFCIEDQNISILAHGGISQTDLFRPLQRLLGVRRVTTSLELERIEDPFLKERLANFSVAIPVSKIADKPDAELDQGFRSIFVGKGALQ